MSAAAAHFLEEPTAGRLTVRYAPDEGDVLAENPPRFSWLPVVDEGARYVLRVSTDEQFAAAQTREYKNLNWNFFTPDATLPAGEWYWCYAEWSVEDQAAQTAWSKTRRFTVADDLPDTSLPAREHRYQSMSAAHPRLWLNPTALEGFRSSLKSDPAYCGWDAFMEKSVQPWIEREVMSEPAPYPNNQRTAPVWRQTYIDCQELLYAIRHQAVAGRVLEDAALTANAKAWLLEAATWDPAGTTSRGYTDEWAYRVALALAWGYDWLYDELSTDERDTVRGALLARTRDVADHAMRHATIQLFPYDSHAVRSVSSVILPCALALLDEEPEAREWLDFSVEFLWTLYSPWGDSDGGWAEGPHYWMTGMAYLIDAANLLKSATGLDLYSRPFFKKTADFALYTKAPDTRRGTFGDDSTMGDLPSLKIGYNVRQFAGVTGNAAYQWYFDEIVRNDPGTEMAFYNWGWWDLVFDDMVYRYDYTQVEAVPPSDIDTLRWFRGVGWAAIQYHYDDPDSHLQLILKSSPYGSISHSHGDQNAFVMSGFGEDLAIQSGYYVAFNSSMHQGWRRQTRSKNAILINGEGQYAGKDKAIAMRSTGSIDVAEQRADHIYMRGDATAAYQTLNPSVTSVIREIYCVNEHYFVVVDSVDAEEEVDIDWLLHANAPMKLGSNSFRYSGERAGFYGQLLWSEAGAPTLEQVTGFPDVDPKDYEGLEVSTCLHMQFPKAKRHRIATLIVPYPINEPRRVFHFLDDQGYDCDLYFTDKDEQSFKITMQKLAKA